MVILFDTDFILCVTVFQIKNRFSKHPASFATAQFQHINRYAHFSARTISVSSSRLLRV
jgi:hypothetical protein